MNKRQIRYITNNQYRKIKKHTGKIAEDFNVEIIHQFRVEYKKLRAFLRMLSNQQVEIKVSKKLKKGYTVSGAIRDLQLQQQRVLEASKQEPKKPQAYLNLLQIEIDTLKPELQEIFLDAPVAESKKKTDASLPDKFPLSGFRNFVQQKWNAVYAIIKSTHFSDDNIHAIRKYLKDLFYNLKTYDGGELKIFSLSIWKGKDRQYFDTLLNELGNFQDRCTAIALLKSYWLDNLNTYNRELLERIKKQWIQEKVNMKQSLLEKLTSDIILQETVRKKPRYSNRRSPDYNQQDG